MDFDEQRAQRRGLLKERLELLTGEITVAQNLRHEPRPQRLPRVHRHNRGASIAVPQEVVTAFDPDDREPR